MTANPSIDIVAIFIDKGLLKCQMKDSGQRSRHYPDAKIFRFIVIVKYANVSSKRMQNGSERKRE